MCFKLRSWIWILDCIIQPTFSEQLSNAVIERYQFWLWNCVFHNEERYKLVSLIRGEPTAIMVPLNMCSAFEEMSKEKRDDSALPNCVKTFLKKHLDIHQFEQRQKAYLLLHSKKPNNFLKHLIQSYALNHLWKHLLLSVIEKNDHAMGLVQQSLEDFIERMILTTGEWSFVRILTGM